MERPSDGLRKLGMTGTLTLPPEKGGVSQLLCDVDECYCPQGRGHFDPISRDKKAALVDWMPTEEHWHLGEDRPRCCVELLGGRRSEAARLYH